MARLGVQLGAPTENICDGGPFIPPGQKRLHLSDVLTKGCTFYVGHELPRSLLLIATKRAKFQLLFVLVLRMDSQVTIFVIVEVFASQPPSLPPSTEELERIF